MNGTSEITAICNKNCKCSTFLSQPVCGSNNVAYFDPCHAGCMFRPTEDVSEGLVRILADLTVSKRPGTSYQIEIHFAAVNHLYLLFSFVNLCET